MKNVMSYQLQKFSKYCDLMSRDITVISTGCKTCDPR